MNNYLKMYLTLNKTNKLVMSGGFIVNKGV